MLCPLCQFDNSSQNQRCRACGAPLQARPDQNGAASDALPGGALLAGTYAVEGVLGQGGFGITYRCHDQMLDRPVAVKEFFPAGCRRQQTQVQPSRGLADVDFRAARDQFLAEARVLARCHHAGIVGVHAAFEANETAYMVMELLHGQSLAQLLQARNGGMEEAEAVAIIERVGAALSFVHEQNLLHRDIKPDNIIVCDDGRVMLIDFGTARETIQESVQGHTVIVTPGYAPLEQYARQARRGAFTDVYSLAATLYHLLSGQMPPAASDRAMGVQLRSVRAENPQISASVAFAVERALQMEIAKRPQSVREFLDLLHAPVPQTEVEAFFHPQLLDLPLDEDDKTDGEIPSMLMTDAIRARQQLWQNVMPTANAQPVQLAPQRAFPLSAQPNAASGAASPPAQYNSAAGNVQIKNASGSDGSMTIVWCLFAIVVGFFACAGLFGSGNRNTAPTYSSSGYSSSSVPSYSPTYSSPSSNAINAPSANEIRSKQAAALRKWDALPVIAPTAVEALPISKSDNSPAMNFASMGGGIEFSPDGKRLAYIDGQFVMRVLSLPNRAVVRSFKLDKNYPPIDMMFTPDNQTIAVTERGKQNSAQLDAMFPPGKETLAAVGREKQNSAQHESAVRTEVWSLRTGKRMGVLDGKTAEDYGLPVAVTNDGQLLLQSLSSVSGRIELSLWNPKTGKLAKAPIDVSSTASLTYSAISPDGKKLVVGDSLGNLRWLDLRSGKQIAQSSITMTEGDLMKNFGKSYNGTVNYPLPVRGIDYALNGKWLASRNEGAITVFDSKARKIDSLIIDAGPMFFSISPDGEWLAAVGSLPYSPAGTLLWNVKTGQQIRLQTPFENMRDFGFSQDGKQFYGIFADGENLQFVTWNVDAKAAQTPRLFSRAKESSFDSSIPTTKVTVAMSQSAQKIAVPMASTIEIRQPDGETLQILDVPNASATLFSPDGNSLAVRKDNGTVQLWSVAEEKMMSQLETAKASSQAASEPDFDRKNVRSMAFSADNNLLAYVRSNGDADVVELWSIQGTPRRLASLNQKEPLNAIAFSPDNEGLICGGEKGLLQWYDVKTRGLKSRVQTGEPIFDIAFAARNLVVMGESNSALYNVPANSADPLQKASRTKLDQAFNKGRDIYTPATISPDGKLLATAQGFQDFQIWELPSGRKLQSVQNGQDSSTNQTSALTFSADSTEVTAIWRRLGSRQVTVSTYRRAKSK